MTKKVLSLLILLPSVVFSFTTSQRPGLSNNAAYNALRSASHTCLVNIDISNHAINDSSFRGRNVQLNAQLSEQEAQKAINTVVNALRKDKEAQTELGRLEKVTNVLGYGRPRNGIQAVRFNAAFKKGGFGRSAVPLPFGLGQTNKSEGRGQMVGQVKASLDEKSGKLLDCSVFRDLGYGRAFNLRV
mmetsp:Transcript_56195/g.168234  ORF Transcript_56195/g.168234 Transcript_56195/m.168234 type:complete len:187 (+) Transcript_56195:328-888(+)|eukprot:CAMPEP_0113557826 /NCGR_PEP_ID=MMETSP0015_2-20120614/18007_1 /TAXON_ID=2838 /ORGANISM="Odontella" /LENGTH=186 /DNA_ID=CAMNT_0000459295 /DNA_START=262 /DNA_END=822 /DNA_ORIENTATION=+ /assembly_acc=CAM_ASM_000160